MTDSEEASARCPFCGSGDTEVLSMFGQQLLTVQYYCRVCRTPFEAVKDPAVIAQLRNRAKDTTS
ncbi:MAG TPA: hypothetical protein VKX16_03940 [Chloroflexota bacterium]|nr:hypothetical protein [Chloroflexota bacterium]